MKSKKIDQEAFRKIFSYEDLTHYDKVLVREVLLKLWAKAYERKEIYKKKSEMSDSTEETIFAEGAKQGLIDLMSFIQDELNDFECPFR